MDALAVQLKEEVDRALGDVEQQRKAVEADREALAEEKESMSQLTSVAASELIELNVGGENITTTRSTLTSAKGSMLASMFSGRWEDKLTRDKEGRVFLDLNPYAVRKVIDHLRLKRLSGDGVFLPAPEIAADMRAEYNGVVDYLGIGEVLLASPVSFQLLHVDASVELTPLGSGETRLLYIGSDFKFLCTDKPIPVGACWKVDVVNLDAGGSWQLLGIIAQKDVSSAGNCSYSCASTYGWAAAGQVYVAGKFHASASPGFPGICKSTYFFQLCEAELLMMQVNAAGTKTVFRLPIAADVPYVIHLNVHNTQTQLVFGPATAAAFENSSV